ncbi:MAG: hypothetical protein LBR10_09135 [Prevotellaceae bacterium]|jgi:hypothetical protein|nr:hypothetical protein [Prevotellaceae bacterium]
MTVKQLNEWWRQCDFRQMETITKTKDYWFSEEDGYQAFVDFCNNWWRSLATEDKQAIYEDHQ